MSDLMKPQWQSEQGFTNKENPNSNLHVVDEVKAPIEFTDMAAKKVAELMVEENNEHLKLRVFITGGGCSGFQYGFTFDETINDDDMVINKKITLPIKGGRHEATNDKEDDESGGGDKTLMISLLVDSASFQYLIGATINYKEDLQGSGFVIINPNATSTCSCGASFNI